MKKDYATKKWVWAIVIGTYLLMSVFVAITNQRITDLSLTQLAEAEGAEWECIDATYGCCKSIIEYGKEPYACHFIENETSPCDPPYFVELDHCDEYALRRHEI